MPFLSADEIALELGVSKSTIRAWTRMKFIPHKKAGRLVKFDPAEVRAWLDKRACPGRDRLTSEVAT